MNNPISEALGELNDSLEEVGADFTIGAEMDLPFKIEVGEETTIETHITVRITEDGWDIINQESQVQRLVEEMKEAHESDTP